MGMRYGVSEVIDWKDLLLEGCMPAGLNIAELQFENVPTEIMSMG